MEWRYTTISSCVSSKLSGEGYLILIQLSSESCLILIYVILKRIEVRVIDHGELLHLCTKGDKLCLDIYPILLINLWR